jgi:hypothetical protein
MQEAMRSENIRLQQTVKELQRSADPDRLCARRLCALCGADVGVCRRRLEGENADLRESVSELKRNLVTVNPGSGSRVDQSEKARDPGRVSHRLDCLTWEAQTAKLERENEELRRAMETMVSMQRTGQDPVRRLSPASSLLQPSPCRSQEAIQAKAENAALRQRVALLERGQHSDMMRQLRDVAAAGQACAPLPGWSLCVADAGGTVQEELEKERLSLMARATMAEAQVEQMQEYMNTAIAEYQKVCWPLPCSVTGAHADAGQEIGRLRAQLQDAKGQLAARFGIAPVGSGSVGGLTGGLEEDGTRPFVRRLSSHSR